VRPSTPKLLPPLKTAPPMLILFAIKVRRMYAIAFFESNSIALL
jgi:hypothetical protein